MTASASSFFPASHPWSGGADWLARRAIDGSYRDDLCWHSGPTTQYSNNQWLRVDLNGTYNVGRVQYYPRMNASNGSFLQYNVYVTSSSSTDPAQWGTAVVQDNWDWPSGAQTRTLTFTPKQGQYVIFQCLSGVGGWAAAGEVWIYRATQSQPPTISAIADQTINRNSTTGLIGFTVSDAETAAASLNVTASSGNLSVIPNGNIILGGSGGDRYISVSSGGVSGSSLITVTVTDADGLAATRQFTVYVRLPIPNFSTSFSSDHSSATVSGSSQAGATVRYTSDGSEPTQSSSTTPPVVTSCGTTLKAKAYQTGYVASETASWICPGTTATVAFSPTGHNPIQYSNGSLAVQMTAEAGATVLYQKIPATLSGLVGHWRFDEGSGMTAADNSGSGYGGLWSAEHRGRVVRSDPH